LSLAEHVCLALVTEGPTHGWAVGSLLAPAGEIGRIWTLSRPLTYRALDLLADQRLVTRRGVESGRGRDRVLLGATAAGRKASARWLDEPVAHLRDVRTELLVKLVLRRRAGLEAEPFLAHQEAVFHPIIDQLNGQGPDDDVVVLWRRESARAVRRFLDAARHPADTRAAPDRPELRLSARNQLRGTVTDVHHGEVMSTVKVVLDGGQTLTAAITREAAEALDLARGDAVVVVVKSTEVMIAKP